MRLRDISLSTRITLWALLFVVAGGLLWMNNESQRDRETYVKERSADLEVDLHLEKDRLTRSVEMMRKDVLFLASLPPVSGIIRASANHGMDPRDRSSKAVWEERLQAILAAFLQAHPEYYQASYIGAAGDGRELVRVDSHHGIVQVTPRDALQAKGDQDFFKAGLVLTAGRVYLSEFSLNQENGKVEDPPRPTLRAVTTVYDASGHVFGMMVLNREVQSLFAAISAGISPDVRSYIADQYGRYLLHPDSSRTFNFKSGSVARITGDFPVLQSMFELQSRQGENLSRIVSDGHGGYLAAERAFFDSGDPARFLLMVCEVPANVWEHGLIAAKPLDRLYTLLVVLGVGAIFMLILRHTFAPLKRIISAAHDISAGNREVRVPEEGGGEIGRLAGALNVMLDRLSEHDLVEKENAFRKELIETLPGIFYMLDANGRFVMWNRSLEQAVQRTTEEIAVSDPLDYFEGEDKAGIEAAIRQAFEQGEASIEAQLIGGDGSRTPYHFTGRRVMLEGEPVVIGLGLDITEQRENMRMTQSLLRRNQVLMQNSMDGIHVMDIDGKLLEANDAFCSMLGYTREEIMQLSVKDWAGEFTPEELSARFRSHLGKSRTFETVHKCKDGTRKEVEICVTGLEIDGKGYLFASARDITERKREHVALQRYKHVIDTAMDGFWLVDANGFLEEVNEAYAKMSGYSVDELVGMHISQLEAYEDEADVRARMEKVMAQGYARFESRHRRKDGRVSDVEISTTYMPESGKFFVFSHNITQRKQAEQDLRVAAAAFETREAILIADIDANIVRVNHAFTEVTGFAADEVIGRNPRIMSSGRHDKAFYQAMWKQVLETGSWVGEIWDRRKNGEIYPKWMTLTAVRDGRGEIRQYVSIFSDITERKKEEEEIRSLAFYDALTMLPNRRLFLERFHTALAASARYGDFGAILFLDLDRFKQLNDTMGHDFGDLMLVEVAARIKSCVREIDTVSRFGGDEFVILLESISSDREETVFKAGVVAEKIRDTLSLPYLLKGQTYESSPSIGVSLYHGNGESMDTLLKYADTAMYQAKGGGRNAVRFYDQDLQQDWESISAEFAEEEAGQDKLF